MKTTLNKIREFSPCGIKPNSDGSLSGLLKLMDYLGKTKTDDEPLSILQILESNGLDDALWCLRAVAGYDKEIRLFAVLCARQVEHLLTDQRSKDALVVSEKFANGEATEIELATAGAAAWAAAWDAARAAARAAGAAARAAQEKELRRILIKLESPNENS